MESRTNPHNTTSSWPVRVRHFFAGAFSLRPFGISETESLMQFARLGELHCFCASRHTVETDADRRLVCRGCGGVVSAQAHELLDRQASQAEIRALTEQLRLAGVRARGLEIPTTVRTVQELHDYLDKYRGRKGRKPPRRPNAPVALSRVVR